MLEHIANRLPQYKEYIVLFNERKDIPHERIVKILALVYADIIGFCQQIYAILAGRRTGQWYPSSQLDRFDRSDITQVQNGFVVSLRSVT